MPLLRCQQVFVLRVLIDEVGYVRTGSYDGRPSFREVIEDVFDENRRQAPTPELGLRDGMRKFDHVGRTDVVGVGRQFTVDSQFESMRGTDDVDFGVSGHVPASIADRLRTARTPFGLTREVC